MAVRRRGRFELRFRLDVEQTTYNFVDVISAEFALSFDSLFPLGERIAFQHVQQVLLVEIAAVGDEVGVELLERCPKVAE